MRLLIDWLTLRLGPEHIPLSLRTALESRNGLVLGVNPDGTLLWRKPMRESVRSDSHQITIEIGHSLRIYGSPARTVHQNNMFGSGDPVTCALDMLAFASRHTDMPFPVNDWDCTRMDVTLNYDLGGPTEVRQALNQLRHAEGGRFQVRTSAETVYWGSVRSALRSGKAYHKGPHLRYQLRRDQCVVNDEELTMADRVLRLELSLKSQFWRERATKRWLDYTEADLEKLHEEYFGNLIGSTEVTEMDDLLQRFEQVAPTEGQALSAYRTWTLIKAVGVRTTQDSMPRATWYRHKKIMFDAGLSWADFHDRKVVEFRRRPLILGQPVRCWEDLRRVA